MKNIFIKIVCLLVCAVMVISLVGCKKEEATPIIDLLPTGKLSDGTGIENDNFSLTWNDEIKGLVLTDKTNSAVWSSTPASYIENTEKSARVNNYLMSQIIVTYFDNREGMLEEAVARGYTDSIRKSDFAVQKDGQSITVSHYFEDIDAIVPVTYTLNNDRISVSIDANAIIEGNSPIYKISVAPYFCSVATGTPDSYLFFPSGTGAVIDTSNPDTISGSYSAEIYGTEGARSVKEKLTNDKSAYLPVYGAVMGDKAICGVISSGAESAMLTANVGDTVTGYSNITTEFYLRGYDYNTVKRNQGVVESSIYASEAVKDTVLTIDFYPLYNEDADYVGMAKLYQKLLYGNNDVNKNVNDQVYALKFFGGLVEQKQFLGFAYNRLFAATTFKGAANILNELSVTGQKPNVQFYGFSKSGADVNKQMGGYGFGSAFGSRKELSNLVEYCNQSGIDTFFDFDLLSYKKGNTFKTAKTANRQAAYQYAIGKGAQQKTTEDYDRYRLLCFDSVKSKSSTLLKRIDKYNLTGISFETLSTICYSDYSSSDYYVRKNYGANAQQIIKKFTDSGYKFAANGANGYAAVVADCILEAPLNSTKCDSFAYDVPFYQLVFKGKTEIAGESVNAGEELWKKQLQCLETGSTMLYTLCENYDTIMTFSQYKGIYGIVYEGNKQNIIDAAAKYGDFYKSVATTTIEDHLVINDDVRVTTFANGVKIYVNYSNSAFETADGTVAARDCLIVK